MKHKDARLQLLENRFSDKVRFIRLDASTSKGRMAVVAYSLEKAPAAVLLDKTGKVVAKTQGALATLEMEQMVRVITK